MAPRTGHNGRSAGICNGVFGRNTRSISYAPCGQDSSRNRDRLLSLLPYSSSARAVSYLEVRRGTGRDVCLELQREGLPTPIFPGHQLPDAPTRSTPDPPHRCACADLWAENARLRGDREDPSSWPRIPPASLPRHRGAFPTAPASPWFCPDQWPAVEVFRRGWRGATSSLRSRSGER